MADQNALEAQITADPRVQQLARQRQLERNRGQLGALPGIITADELRAMGYDVPSDWKFLSQNMRGRQNAGLVHSDKWDYIIPAAVGGLAGGAALAGAFAPAAGGAAGSAVPTTVAAGSGAAVNMAPAATAGIGPVWTPAAAAAAARAAAVKAGNTTAGTDTIDSPGMPPPGSPGFLDWFKDPKNLAKLGGLAALIPALTSGLGKGNDGTGGPSFDNINNEISSGLAMQRKRMEQAQPVYDTLVNMSYGSTPTRYRGAAPPGYPDKASEAPAGPYAYTGPRFG